MSWIRGYSSLRIQLQILRIDLQSELDLCSALSGSTSSCELDGADACVLENLQ